ncbi:hypothetical protein Vadar_032335 [Vaccinium darrowii]|uniref:Uncharacterized protein n=1 Tax=Vaccinium darrowii TaxID=229202 RepID=A0ACB7XE90_9ERIC|nr:hypothetical protein Vadar_032335 [Vaccinium darrowii]
MGSSSWRRTLENVRSFVGNSMGGLRGGNQLGLLGRRRNPSLFPLGQVISRPQTTTTGKGGSSRSFRSVLGESAERLSTWTLLGAAFSRLRVYFISQLVLGNPILCRSLQGDGIGERWVSKEIEVIEEGLMVIAKENKFPQKEIDFRMRYQVSGGAFFISHATEHILSVEYGQVDFAALEQLENPDLHVDSVWIMNLFRKIKEVLPALECPKKFSLKDPIKPEADRTDSFLSASQFCIYRFALLSPSPKLSRKSSQPLKGFSKVHRRCMINFG